MKSFSIFDLQLQMENIIVRHYSIFLKKYLCNVPAELGFLGKGRAGEEGINSAIESYGNIKLQCGCFHEKGFPHCYLDLSVLCSNWISVYKII